MAKSSLEADLDRRERDRKATLAALEKRENERLDREHRERVKKFRADAKRLFAKLFDKVDVKLTDELMEFVVKGSTYYISYDYWYSPKEFGDVDSYAMSGYSWHLRKNFCNTDTTFTLYEKETYGDCKPRTDLYEQVLTGIEELDKPNGRRWS